MRLESPTFNNSNNPVRPCDGSTLAHTRIHTPLYALMDTSTVAAAGAAGALPIDDTKGHSRIFPTALQQAIRASDAHRDLTSEQEAELRQQLCADDFFNDEAREIFFQALSRSPNHSYTIQRMRSYIASGTQPSEILASLQKGISILCKGGTALSTASSPLPTTKNSIATTDSESSASLPLLSPEGFEVRYSTSTYNAIIN